MTEAEALQLGRAAVADAQQAVGADPQMLFAEILRRVAADARLAEAFAIAGYLQVQASQSEKH